MLREFLGLWNPTQYERKSTNVIGTIAFVGLLAMALGVMRLFFVGDALAYWLILAPIPIVFAYLVPLVQMLLAMAGVLICIGSLMYSVLKIVLIIGANVNIPGSIDLVMLVLVPLLWGLILALDFFD